MYGPVSGLLLPLNSFVSFVELYPMCMATYRCYVNFATGSGGIISISLFRFKEETFCRTRNLRVGLLDNIGPPTSVV